MADPVKRDEPCFCVPPCFCVNCPPPAKQPRFYCPTHNPEATDA